MRGRQGAHNCKRPVRRPLSFPRSICGTTPASQGHREGTGQNTRRQWFALGLRSTLRWNQRLRTKNGERLVPRDRLKRRRPTGQSGKIARHDGPRRSWHSCSVVGPRRQIHLPNHRKQHHTDRGGRITGPFALGRRPPAAAHARWAWTQPRSLGSGRNHIQDFSRRKRLGNRVIRLSQYL
jgi:hypothetical protein